MIRQLIIAAKEEDNRPSFCVIVPVIDYDLSSQYPARTRDDGTPSSMPPHCTVLFAKMEEDEIEMAAKAVRQVAETAKPKVVKIGGQGSFPNCVWVHVEGGLPEELHTRLLAAVRSLGIKAEQSFDYQPHSTIEYTDKPKSWKGHVPSGQFKADRIELWVSGERIQTSKLGK